MTIVIIVQMHGKAGTKLIFKEKYMMQDCEFSCMQFCNNQKLPLTTERIKLLFSVSKGPHFCGEFFMWQLKEFEIQWLPFDQI